MTFHASNVFLQHFFQKSWKNLRRALRCNKKKKKKKIRMDWENESQLKRISKPLPLLSQEKLLAEKVKKYPCLLDKSQKNIQKSEVLQRFSLSKSFALFSRFNYLFFEVLKTKIKSSQTLRRPSWFELSEICLTIIATSTPCEHQ